MTYTCNLGTRMRVYSDFLLCVMLEGSWLVAYFTDAFVLAGSKGGGGSGNISALLSSVPRDVNMQLLHVTSGNESYR